MRNRRYSLQQGMSRLKQIEAASLDVNDDDEGFISIDDVMQGRNARHDPEYGAHIYDQIVEMGLHSPIIVKYPWYKRLIGKIKRWFR